MILCDIGNTTYHFYYNNQDLKFPIDRHPVLQDNDVLPTNCIYYISVNKKAEENLSNDNFCVDLKQYANFRSNYDLDDLGIDRVFACIGIDDGVVIDAGSAITVDVVDNGLHTGGYIFPSISVYQQAYSSISPRLAKQFNLGVGLDTLPLNTADALSGGLLHSFLMLVNSISKDKRIYITGGDGKYISRLFPKALYDKFLIFRGMKKVVENNNLLEEFK